MTLRDLFHSPLAIILSALLAAPIAIAQDQTGDSDAEGEEEEKPLMSSGTFGGLKFRGIGPALMSGRIGDIAVNPNNHSEWYVAVASGGVWKTVNNGITIEPIFDSEGSYSIGCVTLDPNDPNVVWVGTGENNSQRSVSFGDGVYKSIDGGASWTNVGLEDSEHVGMIAIDPRDSDVVYVAAQGPLWRAGDDRGLYKTTDGGETWEKILDISEHTGINEVHLDPRNPDVLYASAYQRRRRVWTLINGGPESAIYKSTDAGATWRELTSGLPKVDMGRIGLDIAPADPDVVYAIIEAQDGKGGVFRSTNAGETWSKRNDFVSSSPQYYQEIVCDPHDVDRVYFLETFMRVSEDGGATIERSPRLFRHVDDHALWINPNDPNHLIVGSDGGIYDTYDRGANWRFMANLPITQFYRVAVDNSEPFYFVYGGTQDNNTQGGPSRTTDRAGITNDDWFITVGGDGFEPAIDPVDPMIVYSQWQYGGLIRHDRRSGEILDIKPRERPGDEPYVWNWDSPLLISPHSHTRLYYAGRRVHRSEDRGNSWEPISPNLTRQLDRNTLEVMGEIQKVDAVSKHRSTSIYGNIVALSESPLVEGLLYVGTDDGLIQVSEDGGGSWRRLEAESIDSVPDLVYVSWLFASQHDADVVYAAFDNHKNGDFTPYAYRSNDRGRTWTSIAGDLPERDIVYSIAEDHVNPDLLFAGTEFACYFTVDGGGSWIKIGGMPTISVRDIDIQRREDDLVLATFGRGFYILDDYSPLRGMSEERLASEDAIVFPVRDAKLYVESNRLGGNRGRGFQGASYYAASNPPFGAVITYYIKDKLTTRKEQRQEREKEPGWEYPSVDDMRAESRERDPAIWLTIRDADGNVVQRVKGSREKGVHRAAWNLRYPSKAPIDLGGEELAPWQDPDVGPLVAPGVYSVALASEIDGQFTQLTDPVSFNVVPLNLGTFAADDPADSLAFQHRAAELRRAVEGASEVLSEVDGRVRHLRRAIVQTPSADVAWIARLDGIEDRLESIRIELRGDRVLSSLSEPTSPSINGRVQIVIGGTYRVTSPPTQTQRDQYRFAGEAFERVLADLRDLITGDLAALESDLESVGAPWTPSRLPEWSMDD